MAGAPMPSLPCTSLSGRGKERASDSTRDKRGVQVARRGERP